MSVEITKRERVPRDLDFLFGGVTAIWGVAFLIGEVALMSDAFPASLRSPIGLLLLAIGLMRVAANMYFPKGRTGLAYTGMAVFTFFLSYLIYSGGSLHGFLLYGLYTSGNAYQAIRLTVWEVRHAR